MWSLVALLSSGSTLLALLVTLQVLKAGTDFSSIARYNLMILPAIYMANILLGLGFNKGHQLYHNMSLIIAGQSFIYFLMILFFSVSLLGDKISLGRAFIAFGLMSAAIYLLKA